MKTKSIVGAALIAVTSLLSACGPASTPYTQEQIQEHDRQLAAHQHVEQEPGRVQQYEYGGGDLCYCNYCGTHHRPECL